MTQRRTSSCFCHHSEFEAAHTRILFFPNSPFFVFHPRSSSNSARLGTTTQPSLRTAASSKLAFLLLQPGSGSNVRLGAAGGYLYAQRRRAAVTMSLGRPPGRARGTGRAATATTCQRRAGVRRQADGPAARARGAMTPAPVFAAGLPLVHEIYSKLTGGTLISRKSGG